MTRALPARQGERLKLAAGKAAVTLMSSEYDQLEIRVVRKVATATRDAARELFSDHALNVSFDDLGIVIESGIDTEPDLQQSFGEFAIEVYLPKNYSANVTTIGGAVSAAQVAGDLKCETNGGFVSVGTVDGNATIDSGKGRVKLAHVRGDLSLTSTSGDSIVSKLDGAATVKSLSGNIDVVFTAQPSRQSVLRTASGDIAISLLDRLGFNLEASTEQGSITAPFVSETKNSKRIVSTLNDGGPRLVVESEEGNVFIRQFPVTTDGKRKTDHNKGKAKFHPSDNWISSVCQQNHHLTE